MLSFHYWNFLLMGVFFHYEFAIPLFICVKTRLPKTKPTKTAGNSNIPTLVRTSRCIIYIPLIPLFIIRFALKYILKRIWEKYLWCRYLYTRKTRITNVDISIYLVMVNPLCVSVEQGNYGYDLLVSLWARFDGCQYLCGDSVREL